MSRPDQTAAAPAARRGRGPDRKPRRRRRYSPPAPPKPSQPWPELRRALDERGLTLAALAARAGIPKGSVYCYAAGLRPPGPSAYRRISAALGVPVSELLTLHPEDRAALADRNPEEA